MSDKTLKIWQNIVLTIIATMMIMFLFLGNKPVNTTQDLNINLSGSINVDPTTSGYLYIRNW